MTHSRTFPPGVGSRPLSALVLGLLAVAGCSDSPEPDAGPAELERDPTDYAQDRPAMEQLYSADLMGYWASHGLPPLARLAAAIESEGGDVTPVFDGVAPAFLEPELLAALELGALPDDFASHATAVLEQGGTAWEAFLTAVRNLVQELDAVRAEQGPDAPRIAEIIASLRAAAEIALSPTELMVLTPEGDKVFTDEREPPPNLVCQAGTDAFTEAPAPPTPAPDDQDTSTSIAWDDVDSIPWRTTYNAACGAAAFGACGAKLGLHDDQVTCKEWNEFSQALGAEAGVMGAPMDRICSWFRGQGYCCGLARNGQETTACEEATNAFRRGCDVMMHYEASDHSEAHIEMVKGVVSGAPGDGSCTVFTRSWGQDATVTYDNGTFSGKSDGMRYRPTGKPMSYLEGSGIGRLYYYCPC